MAVGSCGETEAVRGGAPDIGVGLGSLVEALGWSWEMGNGDGCDLEVPNYCG